jgi:hypothetical protein
MAVVRVLELKKRKGAEEPGWCGVQRRRLTTLQVRPIPYGRYNALKKVKKKPQQEY